MAILETKKLDICVLTTLKYLIYCRQQKKAVTVGLETPISNPTTKRYLAEYRLALLQRFLTKIVR